MSVDYAKMIAFNMIGSYDRSLEHASNLLEKSNFSICALYYVALALFKKKRIKEAKIAINAAIKYIATPSAISLHDVIENFGVIED